MLFKISIHLNDYFKFWLWSLYMDVAALLQTGQPRAAVIICVRPCTSYARLLLIDFSSALNTLQPHLLMKRLSNLKVHPCISRWYHSFLTNCSQQVSVNGTLSEIKTLSTGAPQGCVSSPVLFTLYTDECRRFYLRNHIIKFSGDTAISIGREMWHIQISFGNTVVI